MSIKQSIIIAAVVAAAASFGVYANGAYAQSAYANNDDQAVNEDPTATESPAEVAGCWFWEDCKSGNEAVIDTDGAESEIAEGGPGAWICSVAGCNEDGSVIDPVYDGGATVE